MRLEDTCQTTTGVIHGKTVELADDLGFRDGQQVEVRITVVPIAPLPIGNFPVAGSFADFWTDEDDQILAAIAQDRQNTAFREVPE